MRLRSLAQSDSVYVFEGICIWTFKMCSGKQILVPIISINIKQWCFIIRLFTIPISSIRVTKTHKARSTESGTVKIHLTHSSVRKRSARLLHYLCNTCARIFRTDRVCLIKQVKSEKPIFSEFNDWLITLHTRFIGAKFLILWSIIWMSEVQLTDFP